MKTSVDLDALERQLAEARERFDFNLHNRATAALHAATELLRLARLGAAPSSEEVASLREENARLEAEGDGAIALVADKLRAAVAENTRLRAQALDSDAARLGMEGNLAKELLAHYDGERQRLAEANTRLRQLLFIGLHLTEDTRDYRDGTTRLAHAPDVVFPRELFTDPAADCLGAWQSHVGATLRTSDKPAIRQPTSVQPPAGPTKAVSLASPSSDKNGGDTAPSSSRESE